MSRTDEGKESETNEDKQKNEVRDAFTTLLKSHCNTVACVCYCQFEVGGDQTASYLGKVGTQILILPGTSYSS